MIDKIEPKVLCFIFSWKGQYENAVKLEEQLSPIVKTIVINSDDDNKPDHWINIGNECYFSDQFRKALNVWRDNARYDIMWHIQADASYSGNWEDILTSAKTTYIDMNWGVYAPNVNDTFYIPERTDVFNLDNNLTVVGTTDNTCWFIDSNIVSNVIENLSLMEDNQLGWGWDLLACAFSHIKGIPVIRDYNYTIDHPKSTGYKKEQAEIEMSDMFSKCGENLKQIIYYIKMAPKRISSYYNIQQSEELFIYDTNRR